MYSKISMVGKVGDFSVHSNKTNFHIVENETGECFGRRPDVKSALGYATFLHYRKEANMDIHPE